MTRILQKPWTIFFINTVKNVNLKPYKESSLADINEITSNLTDNYVSIKKIK